MVQYPVHMRFRTDGSHDAVDPRPGDVWRVRWYKAEGEGPVAGYAICCPGCGQTHYWTTATNCPQKKTIGMCPHEGTGSCWIWTGSAEEGTLTAKPSLQVTAEDCQWHGFLTNGRLHL